jgi:hypothetical protein
METGQNCPHDSVFNAVKVYLTFDNTGLPHDRYYVSRVRCNDCQRDCCFRVVEWNYWENPEKGAEDDRLYFRVEPISPHTAIKLGLKELTYIHFPAKVAEQVQKLYPTSIGGICEIIRKIMPSRLSGWVLESFLRGNEYEASHYLEDPREFMNRFWRSLQGYCRKILLQERPPVWVGKKEEKSEESPVATENMFAALEV